MDVNVGVELFVALGMLLGCSITILIYSLFGLLRSNERNRKAYMSTLDDKQFKKYMTYLYNRFDNKEE